MENIHAYLTIRYYADKNGTRYKIVSDDRTKWYEAYEYVFCNGKLEWCIKCSDAYFKNVYEFVQGELKNG